MTFAKEDKAVLKILVKKELEEVKKEGEKVLIANSPFLSSLFRMQSKDLPFLKTAKLYQGFLEGLLKKL